MSVRGDQDELHAMYPNVSTNWMSWTDVVKLKVLAMLTAPTANPCYNLLRSGEGGQAAVVMYIGGGPFQWWFNYTRKDGPGYKAMTTQAPGNGLDRVRTHSGQSGSLALFEHTQSAAANIRDGPAQPSRLGRWDCHPVGRLTDVELDGDGRHLVSAAARLILLQETEVAYSSLCYSLVARGYGYDPAFLACLYMGNALSGLEPPHPPI